MTHQRLYSLRWLFLLVALAGTLTYYAYLLGPALAYASGIGQFHFLDYPIRLITFHWTQEDRGSRAFDDTIFGVMMWSWPGGFDWGRLLCVLTVLVFMVASAIAFLWPLRQRDILPARRSIGWPTLVAVMLAWGSIALACMCLFLGFQGAFDQLVAPDLRFIGYKRMAESPIGFLAIWAASAAVAGVTMRVAAKRDVRFWAMERLSFWPLVAGVAALTLVIASGFVDTRYRWEVEHARWNATFILGTNLLWMAWARVIMLFNFARFLRARAEHPDTGCVACGYDLRGSRDRPSCPECGVAIVQKVPEPA